MSTAAAFALFFWLGAASADPSVDPFPDSEPTPCLMEHRGQGSAVRPATANADPSVLRRLMSYAELAVRHRLSGLASYYASFFDGRRTANGEVFHNRKYSAAHRTLPLGTWVEVKARATGRTLRLRVNDRGPFTGKFVLDLSQAAARYLGVDVARDRHVDVRIIALPGEEPLPEEIPGHSGAEVAALDDVD